MTEDRHVENQKQNLGNFNIFVDFIYIYFKCFHLTFMTPIYIISV